jgi:hypothetical protein
MSAGSSSVDRRGVSSQSWSLHETRGSGRSGMPAPALRVDTIGSAPQHREGNAPVQDSGCLACVTSFFVSCWDVICSFFASIFSCCTSAKEVLPPSAEFVQLQQFRTTEKPTREARINQVGAFVQDWNPSFEDQNVYLLPDHLYRAWKAALGSLPEAAYAHALRQFKLTVLPSIENPAVLGDQNAPGYERNVQARMALQDYHPQVIAWLNEWVQHESRDLETRESELVSRLVYFNHVGPFLEKWQGVDLVRRSPAEATVLRRELKDDVEALFNTDEANALQSRIYASYARDLFESHREIELRLTTDGQIDGRKVFEDRVFAQFNTDTLLFVLREWVRELPEAISDEWNNRNPGLI